jgi:hypothetical protein
LNLQSEKLVSRFAFNFNLFHRYAEVWFWWANAKSRARVHAFRAVEREKLAQANVYRRARHAKVKLAKGELGLWSALGVDEAKSLFKKSYERGKLFATRSSYYDTFWLIIAGRVVTPGCQIGCMDHTGCHQLVF